MVLWLLCVSFTGLWFCGCYGLALGGYGFVVVGWLYGVVVLWLSWVGFRGYGFVVVVGWLKGVMVLWLLWVGFTGLWFCGCYGLALGSYGFVVVVGWL